MVISHKYNYVFVELPRTGTTAISDQLVKYYGGEKILIKHASYRNLQYFYKDQFKDYFVFSGVRNPLDRTVSLYVKLKNAEYTAKDTLNKKFFKKRIEFLKQNENFKDYFLKFYNLPYDDWASIDHKSFDFVIRFESLQEDFSEVLKKLKIEQVQSIPEINKTKKKKSYLSYFEDSEVQKRAIHVFGPYCNRFGYELPFENGLKHSSWDNFLFKALFLVKKQAWIDSKRKRIIARKKI